VKFLFGFLLLWFSRESFSRGLFELTPSEKKETEERIEYFYSWPIKPGAMDSQAVKTDPVLGKPLNPHLELFARRDASLSPLLQQAGLKTSTKYLNWYCEKVLRKISPDFPCGKKKLRAWGNVLRDDKVADLAETWVEEIAYSLDEIPVEGESDRPLWSDDYWAMERGLTSYRYSEGQWFNGYTEAIGSFSQPEEWVSLKRRGLEKMNVTISRWSPSEKYDLTIEDIQFSLTNEQKREGKYYENEEGEVEPWMGLCHGWAPASIMVPKPQRPVELPGPEGSTVIWNPNDIKAMVTLAWANGEWESNFIGRRCEQKKLKTFPNGRISSQDCFDTNPATFHLALGNLIGKANASFVMDKAYDYQVWNQPLVGYRFEYFNPLNPRTKSRNWEEVAVDYDKEFKKKDRFQSPLTRGKFMEGSNTERVLRSSLQDGHIAKIVGVIATVVYLVETTPPEFGPTAGEDQYGRDTYLYDLEIAKDGQQWVVTGGEWHQNNHPDFLFVPKKNSFAQAFWDFLGDDPKAMGPHASRNGAYPLCKIVKNLVESSAKESASYPCPAQ